MTTKLAQEALTTVPTYAQSFRDLVMTATLAQMEAASVWYSEAQEVAEDVAELMSISLECGASVVSAFSPRERWATNVAKSYAFANGKPVKGLSNNLKMAEASVSQGFSALKGQKTNAFARAIAGDTEAVVIDVWMMRAANMSTDSPTKKVYRELSEAICVVAQEFGITPRTAQALIWIIVRGGAS
jgi:hypothetical protein